MLKLNQYMHYIGMTLTIIGTVVGIPALMIGESGSTLQDIGQYLVTILVPFGFLLWFTGFVGFTLIRPNEMRTRDDKAHEKGQIDYRKQVPD